MNRRNFLRGIVVAGASFNILPGAGRIWQARRPELIPNPAYVNAPYDFEFYAQALAAFEPILIEPQPEGFDEKFVLPPIILKRHHDQL